MATRGQKPGHSASGAALVWSTYVDGLIAEHGSLAAVCQRVAALRGYKGGRREHRPRAAPAARPGARSRAARGTDCSRHSGCPRTSASGCGSWGQYHSRFVDLPLPLGNDLVQLWDRPPTSESHSGRTWLSLARATAVRADAFADAAGHLDTAAAAVATPAGTEEPARPRGDPARSPRHDRQPRRARTARPPPSRSTRAARTAAQRRRRLPAARATPARSATRSTARARSRARSRCTRACPTTPTRIRSRGVGARTASPTASIASATPRRCPRPRRRAAPRLPATRATSGCARWPC